MRVENQNVDIKITSAKDEINGTERDNKAARDLDSVLEETGPCGKFQWFSQILLASLVIAVAQHQLNVYFLGNDPPWKCVSNRTNVFCRANYGKQIPSDNENFYERCKMNRTDWTYAVHKKYSFVTEFDLVCDRAWMAAFTIGAFYIGGAFGTLPAGTLADKYGRKIVMTVTAMIVLTTSICCSLVTNNWQLLVLRIVLGGAVMSCYSIGFVYSSEIVAPSYRTVATGVYQTIFFWFSELILTLLAYFEREWRPLRLYLSLLCIIPLILIFFFPNSPRWLLQNGKSAEAIKTLHKIAKYNQKSISSEIKLRCDEESSQHKSYTYLDLFKGRRGCCQTLMLAYDFSICAMLYYAIALQSSNLGGNIYQAFVFTSIVDALSFLVTWYGCNKLGRKRVFLGGLVVTSLCLGGCALVPQTYKSKYFIYITLSMIAKLFTNISFVSIFTWSVEIFPTVIRSQGFTFCIAVERFGAFAAPFLISLLRQVSFSSPYIIMIILSCLCGISGFVLPETLGMKTRETLDDFYNDARKTKVEENGHDFKRSCENEGYDLD